MSGKRDSNRTMPWSHSTRDLAFSGHRLSFTNSKVCVHVCACLVYMCTPVRTFCMKDLNIYNNIHCWVWSTTHNPFSSDIRGLNPVGGALCCDCGPDDMLKLVLLTGDRATGPGVCRHLFSTVMFKLRSGLHLNLGKNFICSGCFPYFSQSFFIFI